MILIHDINFMENIDLLIKDLTARLPYWVIIRRPYSKDSTEMIDDILYAIDKHTINEEIPIDSVMPYLRPISSMTDEEFYELNRDCDMSLEFDCGEIKSRSFGFYEGYERLDHETMAKVVDFFNAHHFDYRGLIDKGLALVALDSTYDIEKL